MTRGPHPWIGLLLLFSASVHAENEALLKHIRKEWPKYDRSQRIGALMSLAADPAPGTLAQAKKWLAEDDPVVRAQVVRLILAVGRDAKAAPRAEKAVIDYVARHLKWRREQEKREFVAVCKEHGRKIPPSTEVAAGRNWKDPYDEERRELPAAIKAERLHMREVIAALQETRSRAYLKTLVTIFGEHHDPEVVLRAVACFEDWKEWRVLPLLADLVRIQQWGRGIGGSDVIGLKKWNEMRLKWDVHKDRLWWSRPEYMPRAIRPICAAASTIVGTEVGSAAELDAWLLANEGKLRAHGVRLSPAFRKRAQTSQR